MEEHGYKFIDERSNIRYLILGIKSSILNSVKHKILASAPYCQGYDASLISYKDDINQAQNMNFELNISGVGTSAGESSSEGKFTGNIEYKYYKTAI